MANKTDDFLSAGAKGTIVDFFSQLNGILFAVKAIIEPRMFNGFVMEVGEDFSLCLSIH